MTRSQVLPIALLLTAAGSPDRAVAGVPKVGERHADFTLADIAGGKPVALSDFRGMKVLLVQFASW